MRPRQGNKWLRQLGLVALLVCALATPSARAETPIPSTAAQIAHAEFLPYMDPPPGEPASVCLVDTGVDLNPDTASTVTERVALDGGDPGDVWDRKHGTEMAMVMGAPINNWGTVGAWPLVRIVSVRAMAPGATSFPFSAYARSILACLNRPGVRVINLSFSGERPSDDELSDLEDMVDRARSLGISVVAGAGNAPGPPGFPGRGRGVFAVSAVARDRTFCSFSAQGSAIDIGAPGCDLELADAHSGDPISFAGTSPAAAFVAASMAALLSYRPDLTVEDAESVFRETSGSGVLDVEFAFRSTGLNEAVDAAIGRRALNVVEGTSLTIGPAAKSEPVDAPDVHWSTDSASLGARWPLPRFRSRCTKGRALAVRLDNRPPGAAVVVLAESQQEFRVPLRRRYARSTIRIRSTVAGARLFFSGGRNRDSRVVRLPTCRRIR